MVIVVVIVLFRRRDGYLCLAADENCCQQGRIFGRIGERAMMINPPGHSSSCSNTKQYRLYIIIIR